MDFPDLSLLLIQPPPRNSLSCDLTWLVVMMVGALLLLSQVSSQGPNRCARWAILSCLCLCQKKIIFPQNSGYITYKIIWRDPVFHQNIFVLSKYSFLALNSFRYLAIPMSQCPCLCEKMIAGSPNHITGISLIQLLSHLLAMNVNWLWKETVCEDICHILSNPPIGWPTQLA